MRSRNLLGVRNHQAGFSMIELLMTCFILVVGLLGLFMLQIMSLKAARGGRSLSTAVQVGEAVMDQVEMEGRLSWLNITDSRYPAPTAVPSLRYVNAATVVDTFNIKGQIPFSSPDPADSNPFFTVTTTRTNPVAMTTGQMHDFVVTVEFADASNPAAPTTTLKRTAVLTRRILHG